MFSPSVCLLENLRQEGDTIIIDWLPSASTDVQRYVVYRKLRPAAQWQILTILDSLDDNPAIIQHGENTLIHLADTPEPNSIPYAWAIEAQDSAGNTSGISGQCVAQVAPSKEFKIDINLKASFDKKKKNVNLSWKYDYSGKRDYYGVVYRSVDGGEFKDIDTFYPGDKNYTDHNAPEGSQCTYYIELRLPKGVVSNPSNNAKVSVK